MNQDARLTHVKDGLSQIGMRSTHQVRTRRHLRWWATVPCPRPRTLALLAFCVAASSGLTSHSGALSNQARASEASSQRKSSEGRYYLYVSVGEEHRIAEYRLNPQTGELAELGSADCPGAPGSLAVDPKRRYLYAAVRSTGSVATYSIDPATAHLKQIGLTRVLDNPVYIVPDQSGRYLLTAYYGAGKAAVYPIEKNGIVGAQATSIVTTDTHPHSILGDPSNRFVFVPNTGADLVKQYRFDADNGLLSPNEEPELATAPGSGPRHFAFHPKRDIVYFVNEKGSSVTVCRLDRSTGRLAALQSISTLPDEFQGDNTCADIHVTPSGRHVYASNRGHDSLACFAVDESTGKLTSLGQAATEKTPREFDVDPTGRFVYSAGQASGRLASYEIDPSSGKLVPLTVYEVGRGPAWVLTLRLPDAND